MAISPADIRTQPPLPGDFVVKPMEGAAHSRPDEQRDLLGNKKPERKDEPNIAALSKNLQQLNDGLRSFGLKFELSDTDHQVITRVVDRETGELIRQIPSEEVLRIARSLHETLGLLLKTSA